MGCNYEGKGRFRLLKDNRHLLHKGTARRALNNKSIEPVLTVRSLVVPDCLVINITGDLLSVLCAQSGDQHNQSFSPRSMERLSAHVSLFLFDGLNLWATMMGSPIRRKMANCNPNLCHQSEILW
jgi:hypothetical protein